MPAQLASPSVISLPPRRFKAQLNADVARALDRKELDRRLAKLAKLDDTDYELQREEVAKELEVRTTFLDSERTKRRPSAAGDDIPGNHDHWRVDPWDRPVDTAQLLDAVTNRITHHVATLDNRATAVGLWIMFTWVHEHAVHSPLLLVRSPERDSGKTTLLGVISYLVRRPLTSVSITGAALFRSIKKWGPRFVIDEADATFERNNDLREVINSGWTRGQGA